MLKNPWSDVVECSAEAIGDDFLLAGKCFRKVQDQSPDDFDAFAKAMGVSRRKAYYLAQIDRAFSELGVDKQRLYDAGWTKLKLIAEYVNRKNVDGFLTLTEMWTVRELTLRLRFEEPVEGTRTVLMYLTPLDYEVFAAVVLAHGGILSGNGIINKESALIAALAKLLD